MAEAVVVAVARSPIGRAFKGSMVSIRPDDLTVQMIAAALAKVPQLDPADIDDIMLGCGLPGGEQGYNMARVVAIMLGYDTVPGTTVTRYCSSSLQTTRMAYHAIKAGEGDVFVSAGVECVSRFAKGSSDGMPDTKNPVFADGRGPLGRGGQGRRRRLARPARGRRGPRRLHRHGPDRRERRGAARDHPRRPGRVRRPVAEPGREGAGQRLLAARHHARHAARRHRGERRRRPAAGHHAREGGRTQARVPPRRHRHGRQLLPAERRRGRGRHHERPQGRRARASRRWPASSPPGSARCRRRSWAWARSRPPGRR